jgi:transcriptional regulatory protein LevR
LYPIHNRVLYDKIGILLSDICGKKSSYEGFQLGFYFELEAAAEGRQIQHKTLKSICNLAGLDSLLKKLDGKFRLLEADLKSVNIPYNYAYTLFCWMHFIFNHKQTFDNRIYLMSNKSDIRQATADTVNKLLGFNNIEVLDKSIFMNPHLDQHNTGIVILDTDDAQSLLSDMISDKLDKAVRVVIHDISTTNVVVLSSKIIQYNWDYDRLINNIKKQQSAFSEKNHELSMSAIILLVCDENEPSSRKIKDVLLNIMNMTGNANITIYVLGLNQCRSYEELDRQVMELLNKHSIQFAIDLINYSYRHTGLNVIPFEAFIKRSNLMDLISGLSSRDISRSFLQNHIDDLAGLTDEEISINITRFISFIDINKVHEAFNRCATWLYRSFSYQLAGIERVRLYLYISILLERVISGKYATASFSGALSENTRKIIENVSYTLEKYFNISIPASERIMLGKMVFERDDGSLTREI